MKVLWLCNNAPSAVRSAISGKTENGVNWVDHVLSGLRQQGVTLRILYRGTGEPGQIDEKCSYASFPETPAHVYRPEQELFFRQELRAFQPDVIHSWGVEYNHALAMVNAAEKEGMLPHMAASIQGLCRYIAEHYADGVPERVQRSNTFRDFIRQDNIRQQQEKFVLRGKLEAQTIGKLHHVIGRTHWDLACTKQLNPGVNYHFCNETLREPFYEGQWSYADCQKHRIFASSCSYPVKGFHYLLEAFAQVRETYPDATLTVTGRSFLPGDIKGKLRRNAYEVYLGSLAKQYHLEDAIDFSGNLTAEGMKQAFLNANVFVLPSTMENSPNSLGEAMLLGVPCVASDVGGVASLMQRDTEGYLYQSGSVSQLARYIGEIFAMEEAAASLGQAARNHAAVTHDPEKNLQTLLDIYQTLM